MNASIKLNIFNKVIDLRITHAILILLLLGGFIRFFELTYAGLWLDEIYSMLGSAPEKTISEVYTYSIHDQPPLFFLLLHGWLKIFGFTDFAGRSLTCLFGLIGIVAIFFLGKELKDEKLGLLTAFLTTINYSHTDISKEIRFYPLVFLLTTISFLFFLKSVKNPRAINFLFYILFTSLLLNTHYYGMVVFVTQFIIFIVIIIIYKQNKRLIIGGLIAGLLTGLSLWHWLDVILSDIQINSFHVKPVGFDFPFLFLWSYIKDPIAYALSIICIGLAFIETYRKIKVKKIWISHLSIILWILLSYLIPLLYSLLKLPLLTPKYTIIAVPAIIIVIAYGFLLIPYQKFRSYAMITILLSGLLMLFIARPPYKPRRAEDWREVAAYFKQNYPTDKIIFSQLSWFHTYYFQKNNLTIPIDQNRCNFDSIVQTTDRLWLFLNNRYTGGWPINGFLPNQKKIIENEFSLTDSVEFKQTKALLYRRKE